MTHIDNDDDIEFVAVHTRPNTDMLADALRVSLALLRHIDDEIALLSPKHDPVCLHNLRYWATQLRQALAAHSAGEVVGPWVPLTEEKQPIADGTQIDVILWGGEIASRDASQFYWDRGDIVAWRISSLTEGK